MSKAESLAMLVSVYEGPIRLDASLMDASSSDCC